MVVGRVEVAHEDVARGGVRRGSVAHRADLLDAPFPEVPVAGDGRAGVNGDETDARVRARVARAKRHRSRRHSRGARAHGVALRVGDGQSAPDAVAVHAVRRGARGVGEQLPQSRPLELAHEVARRLLQGEHLDAPGADELDDALGVGLALIDVAGHDAKRGGGGLRWGGGLSCGGTRLGVGDEEEALPQGFEYECTQHEEADGNPRARAQRMRQDERHDRGCREPGRECHDDGQVGQV